MTGTEDAQPARDVAEALAWFRENPAEAHHVRIHCYAAAADHAATIVRAALAAGPDGPAVPRDVARRWLDERDEGRAEIQRLRAAAGPAVAALRRIAALGCESTTLCGQDPSDTDGDLCRSCLADVELWRITGDRVATDDPPPEWLRAAARPAGDATAALLSLDDLIEGVELALESSAIEVTVWETHPAETGGRWRTDRTGESTDPLYRLTRCLRSAGLLDERRDDDDRGDVAGLLGWLGHLTDGWTAHARVSAHTVRDRLTADPAPGDDTTEVGTFQRGWREGASWQRRVIRDLVEAAKTSNYFQHQLDTRLADDPGEGQQR
ncbi:MAG: hypothetical protein L0I76_16200 [Pseudonocardia sp.]|nr:hypothetical protein [Pseudonocardia sp.]